MGSKSNEVVLFIVLKQKNQILFPLPTAEDVKHQTSGSLLLVGISQILARQKSSQIQQLGELKIFCDSKITLNFFGGIWGDVQ